MSVLAPTLPPAPDVATLVDMLADHDRPLRALALSLLGDAASVDDVLQEAYLRAARALPRFRGDSSLATWLYRIVHNVCIDELRRRRRRPEDNYDEAALETAVADSSDAGVDRVDLAAGLAGLPHEQRAAVVLVDGYGMGYADAARVLGVPAGTVGSRAFRARIVLRRALAVQSLVEAAGPGGVSGRRAERETYRHVLSAPISPSATLTSSARRCEQRPVRLPVFLGCDAPAHVIGSRASSCHGTAR